MKEDEGEAVDFSARWTECRSSVNQAEVNGEALNTCRRRDMRIRETAGICHSDRGISVAKGRTTHVGPGNAHGSREDMPNLATNGDTRTFPTCRSRTSPAGLRLGVLALSSAVW